MVTESGPWRDGELAIEIHSLKGFGMGFGTRTSKGFGIEMGFGTRTSKGFGIETAIGMKSSKGFGMVFGTVGRISSGFGSWELRWDSKRALRWGLEWG